MKNVVTVQLESTFYSGYGYYLMTSGPMMQQLPITERRNMALKEFFDAIPKETLKNYQGIPEGLKLVSSDFRKYPFYKFDDAARKYLHGLMKDVGCVGGKYDHLSEPQRKAIETLGFNHIEIVGNCIVLYGSKAKMVQKCSEIFDGGNYNRDFVICVQTDAALMGNFFSIRSKNGKALQFTGENDFRDCIRELGIRKR